MRLSPLVNGNAVRKLSNKLRGSAYQDKARAPEMKTKTSSGSNMNVSDAQRTHRMSAPQGHRGPNQKTKTRAEAEFQSEWPKSSNRYVVWGRGGVEGG